MTDDLVKRLRIDRKKLQSWYSEELLERYEAERNEAADRIEQLEAALREILSNNPIRGDTGSSTLKEIVEAILKSSVIARAALGDKKDGN